MQDYQRSFLEFALEARVLQFGEFTLKSGRRSPYFFNTGLFNTGGDLARLGHYYSRAIQEARIPFDMLYGPAYKGIPLVTATVISLALEHERDVPYSFNRKEAKDHGEGGMTVGSPLAGQVLIVDDVISAGTSVRESVEIIAASGATPAGVAITLDRQERGTGPRSAVQEVQEALGIPVVSVATLSDLVSFLEERDDHRDELERVRRYRETYGV